MKAIIQIDVPEHQIGQEVSVYFKDTMCVKSVCTPLTGTIIIDEDGDIHKVYKENKE